QDPGPRLRDVEHLGEQLGEVVHLHPAVAQRLGEGVVLLPRPLAPQDVVEQQPRDVRRGQPAQLKAGPVQDHLAQLAGFGVDVEGRGRPGLSVSGRVRQRYGGTGAGWVIRLRIARYTGMPMRKAAPAIRNGPQVTYQCSW